MATYLEATNLSSSLDAACQAWFVSCYVFYMLCLLCIVTGCSYVGFFNSIHADWLALACKTLCHVG